MLHEIEFSKLKETMVQDPCARFYLIMRNIPSYIKSNRIQECPVLAPSEALGNDRRLELITVVDFVEKYKNEMKSPVCQDLISFILEGSEQDDIYLVSINRDRLDLLDIIEDLKTPRVKQNLQW